MERALLQFCFCQRIDASAASKFEKDVFEDSYREFQLQCQAYNTGNSMNSFEEMVQYNPKANSLHYKVGFAVGLYIQELKGMIPGLYDEAGNPVHFIRHEFKIIQSEAGIRNSHQIAIRYFTEAFLLLKNFGEYMVLALDNSDEDKPVDTFTLKMRNSLSIVHFVDVHEKWDTIA